MGLPEIAEIIMRVGLGLGIALSGAALLVLAVKATKLII